MGIAYRSAGFIVSYFNEFVMYLEERVAHLENITTEHGKQIEMVAEGLATVTTRVDRGFEEMRTKFVEYDARFEQIDARFERIERRLDRLEEKMDRVEAKLVEHDARFDRIDQQFLQIHGVLAEIVTLVKNKL